MKPLSTSSILQVIVLFCVLSCAFSHSLKAQKETVEKLLEKARTLVKEGKDESAYLIYEKVTTIDLKNKFAYNGMGNCYKGMEKLDSAIIFYEKALEIDDKYAGPYYNLSYTYAMMEDYEKALEYSIKYTDLEPFEIDGYVTTGSILNDIGEPDSALVYFQKAFEINPKEHYLYYYIGDIYQQKGMVDTAIHIINQVIELDTTKTYSYYVKALLYDKGERYKEAIKVYTQVLEKDSTYIDARLNRMIAYYEMDDSDNVLRDAQILMTKNPEDLIFYYYAAAAELQKGNKDACLEYIEKAVKMDEDATPGFYPLKGLAYWMDKEYDKADAIFDQLIALNPKDIQTNNLKLKSQLFRNMPPDVATVEVSKSNWLVRFKEIHSNNLENMDKWVNDKNHKYYYPSLAQKYKENPLTMSLDEYFMYYYGDSEQSDYSPYGKAVEKTISTDLRELMEKGKFEETMNVATKAIESSPFSFDSYVYGALTARKSEDYALMHSFLHPYLGFMEGILATGNGKDFENAYVVTTTSDEYGLFEYMGYRSRGQALYHNKGQSFDGLTTRNEKGNITDVMFNISKSFNSLSDMFKDTITLPKEGKKKKKKKSKN